MLHQENDSHHFMYVVSCADGTLYTGYTTDVEHRVGVHNAGPGAKSTRSRLPVRLVAQARFQSKQEAMSAEYHFKRLSRAEKERLVELVAEIPFEDLLRPLFS